MLLLPCLPRLKILFLLPVWNLFPQNLYPFVFANLSQQTAPINAHTLSLSLSYFVQHSILIYQIGTLSTTTFFLSLHPFTSFTFFGLSVCLSLLPKHIVDGFPYVIFLRHKLINTLTLANTKIHKSKQKHTTKLPAPLSSNQASIATNTPTLRPTERRTNKFS